MLRFCLRTSLLIFATVLFIAPVSAMMIKLKIVNKSTEALNSFTVTLRGSAVASSPNRLGSTLAIGATSPLLSFDPGGTACVFDLTFTTASAKVTNQPDVDLCQTDALVFQ